MFRANIVFAASLPFVSATLCAAPAILSTPPVYGLNSTPQAAAASPSSPAPTGILSPTEAEKLLPPSVYFNGQTAPLQIRNAAVFREGAGAYLWASLVDASGYSTGIRERYQFYLVAENAVDFAGEKLAAGVYGGGFLADGSFVLLDIGGHDVLHGKVKRDATLQRPKPLQMMEKDGELRLYLGRQFVTLKML